MGRLGKANQSYQAALEIRRSIEQPTLACEPLAGLARLAQASGDLQAAQVHMRAILAHLDAGGTLEGTDEPLRVYWTCCQVLQAINDPRGNAILELAYAELMERAGKIKAESARRSFLENVQVHREILAAHASR